MRAKKRIALTSVNRMGLFYAVFQQSKVREEFWILCFSDGSEWGRSTEHEAVGSHGAVLEFIVRSFEEKYNEPAQLHWRSSTQSPNTFHYATRWPSIAAPSHPSLVMCPTFGEKPILTCHLTPGGHVDVYKLGGI